MDRKCPIIRLDAADNIVVARVPIEAGVFIPQEGITTRSEIPLGHKVASRAIQKGEPVRKYNTIIGYASRDIEPGSHMHNDEILFDKVDRTYSFCSEYKPAEVLPPDKRRTFRGYVRGDGRVGTRNFIVVPAASNCAATVARKIADHFTEEVLKDYPNVDGVVPLITAIGCGMEKGDSIPMTYLRRVIGGHIKNPNIAGAVVCAIGCENNNIDRLFETQGLEEGPLLKKIVIQECGGGPASVRLGISLIEQMLPIVNEYHREEVTADKLVLALECGGSDSFSGSSANPGLGKAVDLLVRNGGTACLTETTELFSAEHTLTRRAKTPEVGQKLVDCVNWWLEYCRGKDSQINGKVTPGNNAGGLTNILEKALGSAKKGGSTPLNAVYGYAEPIRESGFVIMDAPSYDPAASTAQFAGGCTVCAFTTGRGSCYGSRYFPTIKIASNTQLYERMPDDMDINAGQVIDGDKTLDEIGEEIFEKILAVASGETTKSEAFGMGADEFVPWDIGITG
jgi:altronate hydrolase